MGEGGHFIPQTELSAHKARPYVLSPQCILNKSRLFISITNVSERVTDKEIDSTKQDDIIMVPEIPQSLCVESQDKEIVVKKENVTHREVENFKVDDNFESEKLIKLKEYYGNMECEDVVLVQNKVDDKDKKQKDVTMVSESLNNKVSNGVSMKPSDPVIKKVVDIYISLFISNTFS